MKKTIITISMTVAMAAFLSVGCGGETVPTEPTAADEAEAGQIAPLADGEKHDKEIDPSDPESNTQGSPNPAGN
tara:strand:+ start:377 stop:598 length:222 start_codon:yes stop_codon:yes gene_type:complete